MFVNFTFSDGSNPYIAKSNKELFHMIQKYSIEQTGAATFHVDGTLTTWTIHPGRKVSAYKAAQSRLESFAIDFSNNQGSFNMSWGEWGDWCAFFEEYGKKYGLLREFRENGLC